MSIFRRRKAAPPDVPVRVYTKYGHVAHLMAAGLVLCPTSPGPAGWAKRDDAEAESYPLCAYCRDALADLGGGVT